MLSQHCLTQISARHNQWKIFIKSLETFSRLLPNCLETSCLVSLEMSRLVPRPNLHTVQDQRKAVSPHLSYLKQVKRSYLTSTSTRIPIPLTKDSSPSFPQYSHSVNGAPPVIPPNAPTDNKSYSRTHMTNCSSACMARCHSEIVLIVGTPQVEACAAFRWSLARSDSAE